MLVLVVISSRNEFLIRLVDQFLYLRKVSQSLYRVQYAKKRRVPAMFKRETHHKLLRILVDETIGLVILFRIVEHELKVAPDSFQGDILFMVQLLLDIIHCDRLLNERIVVRILSFWHLAQEDK